jgi:hypothetical protein
LRLLQRAAAARLLHGCASAALASWRDGCVQRAGLRELVSQAHTRRQEAAWGRWLWAVRAARAAALTWRLTVQRAGAPPLPPPPPLPFVLIGHAASFTPY